MKLVHWVICQEPIRFHCLWIKEKVLNIGVSTGCFFPRLTIDALKSVAETGVKYAEIFFNTDSELEESYVKQLKTIADENGIKIISIHPFTSAIETFMFWSKSDYKLQDSIKYYEKYFKACNILGAKYVVIHGCNSRAEYMSMEKYTHILNQLSRKAREYGVYIAQENVVKFKCGYLQNLKEFLKYADEDIRFVFDLKQSVRAQQNMYDIIDLMGNRISYMHISDYNEFGNSLLPGQGTVDFKKLFDYVNSNYGVKTALIEVYNENITEEYGLKNALDFFNKI